jgi:hypothetical protein
LNATAQCHDWSGRPGIVFEMRGYRRQINVARVLAHSTDHPIAPSHFEVPVITRPNRQEI